MVEVSRLSFVCVLLVLDFISLICKWLLNNPGSCNRQLFRLLASHFRSREHPQKMYIPLGRRKKEIVCPDCMVFVFTTSRLHCASGSANMYSYRAVGQIPTPESDVRKNMNGSSQLRPPKHEG